MVRRRVVRAVLPARSGVLDGLAYTLWLPDAAPRGAIVVLHGAGSCKESHYDYARAALPLGLATVTFDQRGHGESDGPLDDRVIDDVLAMCGLVREVAGDDELPLALRGSSMGGYVALVAAGAARAEAVVAICPASAAGLRRGLAEDRFSFAADAAALDGFLATHEIFDAASALSVPVLLLHAEGDEVVPVQQSRELAGRLAHPASRLIAVPGGHHRSVQHDEELQAVSLKFVLRAFEAR